jgi:Tfp pilus assembly protein PilV
VSVRDRIGKEEAGIGIIELVIAIAIINVAILAMFAMFQAGALSLLRASRTSNGSVVAEKQMELYRGMLYTGIALNDTLANSSSTTSDTIHTGASAWGSASAQVKLPGSATPPAFACASTSPECIPIQSSVSGPDGRAYRVDSYVTSYTPPSGRPGKQVTVDVRLAADTTKVLATLTSNFDQATGCIDGNAYNPC